MQSAGLQVGLAHKAFTLLCLNVCQHVEGMEGDLKTVSLCSGAKTPCGRGFVGTRWRTQSTGAYESSTVSHLIFYTIVKLQYTISMVRLLCAWSRQLLTALCGLGAGT